MKKRLRHIKRIGKFFYRKVEEKLIMFLAREEDLGMYRIEVARSRKDKKNFARFPVPPFDLGLDYLGLQETKSRINEEIYQYAHHWFNDPYSYLRCDENIKRETLKEKDFYTFPSIVEPAQQAKFYYYEQPQGKLGRKVALIYVMHWNGNVEAYQRGIRFIKKFLPISAFLHVPANRGFEEREDEGVDYEDLSPNIGKTILKTRQNIQDIQYMARWLKEKMGYEEVGLLTYSIGSLYGVLASSIYPKLFDFAIFHMACDDFAQTIMRGVATRDIAQKIKGNIDYQLLSLLWSTISAGMYEKYFINFPAHTRFVQCKYDFVFGEQNVRRFNEKVRRQRPDIEIEEIFASHTTYGLMPGGIESMMRNIRFIYQNTLMRNDKRAKFFVR